LNNIFAKFPTRVVEELVLLGVEITVRNDSNGIYIDLNTGMKSHCHLHYNTETEKYFVNVRYDGDIVLDCWNDLHYAVMRCEQGRGFMSSAVEKFYKLGFNNDWEWDNLN